MRQRLARVVLALSLGLGVAAAAACGTDAVGVESCRQIESVRCRRAPGCPKISLEKPYHPDGDIDACIRYYNDACQHGLASGTDPGGPTVNACVAAIANGSCDVVQAPEKDPACAFLVPPAPAPDAAVVADSAATADGASD